MRRSRGRKGFGLRRGAGGPEDFMVKAGGAVGGVREAVVLTEW